MNDKCKKSSLNTSDITEFFPVTMNDNCSEPENLKMMVSDNDGCEYIIESNDLLPLVEKNVKLKVKGAGFSDRQVFF